MKKNRSFVLAVIATVAVASANAETLSENFGSDPFQRGWAAFGNTNLFQWNPSSQSLDVTWNSSQSNSFFWHPLGTILNRDDDFSFAFDLLLREVGPASEYVSAFQLALGMLNIDQAQQPGFLRGSGFDSPNLVEFDYFRADAFFPDTAFPTAISSNMVFNYNPGLQNSTNYTIALDTWHRIQMTFSASSQAILLEITRSSDNSHVQVLQPLNETFTDFRVGAFSISSYNDGGQFPGFEGSILARGSVDNILVITPTPPVQHLSSFTSNETAGVTFMSRTNFSYTLERTTDLQHWSPTGVSKPGTGGWLQLEDEIVETIHAFYRVRAVRP
ncbi:MAG TPA: hypothetical protein VEH04_15015 [Verrucomicrobiae bacterium]|nr:hypothetical protein [Verrucomicrobiae bacterium]